MDYLCDWVLSETWGYSFKVLQYFRLQFPNNFVALSRKIIFQGVEKEKRDECCHENLQSCGEIGASSGQYKLL